MQQYIGAKVVSAESMNRRDYHTLKGWDLSTNENGDDLGYHIADGKENRWMSKDEFERLYRENGSLTFGQAVDALKSGKLVCRKGWNGAGMFLRLMETDFYELNEDKVPEFKRGSEWNLLPFIMMKTAQNTLVPWLASQTDILVEDWMVLSE